MDGPALAQIAEAVNERDAVSGVICWYEGRIHLAAHIAGALGLRNGDPAVIWRLRDKAQTRATLAAAGIRQPGSIPVKTLEEALAAAQRVGYPAILKPRGFGASYGVVRVDGAGQLRERFAFTRDTPWPEQVIYSTDQPFLVEECVSGEEISIDSVIQDGSACHGMILLCRPNIIWRSCWSLPCPPYVRAHRVPDGRRIRTARTLSVQGL